VSYNVTILPRAKIQLSDQALWWSKHRSTEQALRWLDGFEAALASLAQRADRCGLARESAALASPIRELHYGVRGKVTHRAFFEIRDDEVIVHCVRHLAQRDITSDDIA
jgi:plasmid stabilization system protein ParE